MTYCVVWSLTDEKLYKNGKVDMVLFPGGYATVEGGVIADLGTNPHTTM